MQRRWFLAGAAASLLVGCGGLFKRTEEEKPEPARGTGAEGGASKRKESPVILLFGLGVHVEPLAEGPQPGKPGGQGPSYELAEFYERHMLDIQDMARVVEAHGGRLTIQLQRPFTSTATQKGEKRLAALAQRGHEIAQHCHENVWLGQGCERLPAQRWVETLKPHKAEIEALSGKPVRYFSGGNLYPHLPEVLAALKIPFNGDYKNPRQQSQPQELAGVNPWRPAGGASESDIATFARHDPAASLVFLPEGIFSATQFQSAAGRNRDSVEEWYAQARARIPASVEAARPDRVNVAHLTVHPGEMTEKGGPPKDRLAAFDRFLTEQVDPLREAGRLKWATYSEMGDAFLSWEKENPKAEARG